MLADLELNQANPAVLLDLSLDDRLNELLSWEQLEGNDGAELGADLLLLAGEPGIVPAVELDTRGALELGSAQIGHLFFLLIERTGGRERAIPLLGCWIKRVGLRVARLPADADILLDDCDQRSHLHNVIINPSTQ